MYVCVCNQVTDSEILEAADRGATTLEALGNQLKVATCCGRCAECAHELLATHASRQRCDNTLQAA
ncbi:MAG: (2Fe-2S)-binding protein [Candidatus Thiodiazotropha sp.]